MYLEATIESYIAKWEVEYGKEPLDTTTSDRFRGILKRVYEQTGQRAVVLIDEYDKPILDVLDTGASRLDHSGEKRLLEDHHRELLAAFYSTFKGADEYLKFVLLTGVTKFSQVSMLNAFDMQEIRDYWFATGTPSYLMRLLQHSREHINELVGKYYKPALFIDYKADVEKPLPMIYQSGYLTMKEYNMRMGTYLLDFPNNEVREGFLSLSCLPITSSPEARR